MCEVGNLIDLTCWDGEKKDEEAHDELEPKTDATSSFKGPYDPFDCVEKEACIKAINLETQAAKPAEATTNELDPDLNNESPPVGMQAEVDGAVGGLLTRQRSLNSSNNSFQKHLLKLKAAIGVSTPQNGRKSQFEKRILSDDLQMLSAESPLKLIDDDQDDTLSRAKFEADLKLMRISSFDSDATTVAAKTETHPQIEKSPSVGKLLQDLKNLVNDKLDEHLKKEFNVIIDSLSAAIGSACELKGQQDNAKTPTKSLPHVYTRQGTFDLDLDIQTQERRTKSLDIVECGAKMQELPDVMTSSSATYDCEPEEREPVIESHSFEKPKDPYMREVVDATLALQINELLERHNLTQSTKGDLNELSTSTAVHNETVNNQRPTVILVVNNPLTGSLSSIGSQLPSSCMAYSSHGPSESKINQISAQTDSSSGSTRRRSSSLSIHDKFQHMPDISVINQGQQHHQKMENSQNIAPKESQLKTPLTSDKSQAMAGFRQRRNSFSNLSASTANGSKAAVPGPRSALQVSNNQAKRHIFGPRTSMAAQSTISKSTGPMKAVIPVKRVAPTLKTPNVSSMDTFDESSYQNPMMTPHPRTAQKVFCTSTPIPQMRQSGQQQRRNSLRPSVASSNSNSSMYSTPQVRRASFSRKTGGGSG
ncbi:uncharacterized protein LOC6648664 [Drosophila willistoni]|uniref:uncharacterized protein LOC6648664 n=1 Tax=Drosophila willistoni TaxID=7260 RepID=UPI00017D8CDF|nr:uncharacterized protein LOC6648664 [Drosophila willistoni]